MLPIVTMEGRLGREPELRFTPAGKAVCSFSIVAQDRRKNDATGQWEDAGDPMWVRVSVWEKYGENCAESLAKGDTVVVTGKLSTRKWTNKDNVEQTSLELSATEVSVPLRWRTVPAGQRRDPGEVPRQARRSEDDDPWNTPAQSASDALPPF